MAAVQLSYNVPDRRTVGTTRQRYVLPTTPLGARKPVWVRIYSSVDCYLELLDVADGGALGSSYETIPAGTPTARALPEGLAAFAVAGSASQTIEVTVAPSAGT